MSKKKVKDFANLKEMAIHLRDKLKDKKNLLLFAYNGTGKTRLSMAFKNLGRKGDKRNTLYFNAFTEDLFSWDNDLNNDSQRVLKLNADSFFFNGMKELTMETLICPLLHRYADFDFKIDYNNWTVNFSRERKDGDKTQTIDHIKISRGEENIFVWCFFLAIAQLAIDGQEAYSWVKYLYIDDPISSLDDNNAIAVASHLAQLLKEQERVKAVISSHHTLFFNVLCNEFGREKTVGNYFLRKETIAKNETDTYILKWTGDTPCFHHVALLTQLHEVAASDKLYTYHFNMLRNILEKTATFHGFKNFSACIKQDNEDAEGIIHARMVNILSHGNYSLFEPMEMMEENKQHFKQILKNFMINYRFNPALFPDETEQKREESIPA